METIQHPTHHQLMHIAKTWLLSNLATPLHQSPLYTSVPYSLPFTHQCPTLSPFTLQCLTLLSLYSSVSHPALLHTSVPHAVHLHTSVPHSVPLYISLPHPFSPLTPQCPTLFPLHLSTSSWPPFSSQGPTLSPFTPRTPPRHRHP